MELLADENIDTEWVQALRDDGQDVFRVVDIEGLGVSTTDPEVLAGATQRNRVLLTADQSDFSDPPTSDHPGIIIIADVTRCVLATGVLPRHDRPSEHRRTDGLRGRPVA
jgi:predicted nuclease of predicted toxin-antitoxin system